MADIKPNPIINAAAANAQATASDQQAKLDIAKQMDVQDALTSDMTGAVQTAMQADQIIVAQKNAASAKIDAQNAAAQSALSTDWTQQGSRSNYWAAEMASNAQKAYDTLDVIKEKQTKTLLSDPLGFIDAQFTLPADIATHNYYAEKHNVAEGALNEITRATNDAAIMNNNMREQTSAAAAEAEQTKVAASAAISIGKLNMDMAGKKITGIVELNNLTTQQAALAYQALNADNEQKRLAMQAQSNADQHAQRMMMMQDRQDKLDQKAVDRGDLEAMMNSRNAGATMLGKPKVDNVDIFRREYMANQKNPDYQNMIGLGQQIGLNGGSVSGISVAQTAGDAARIYSSGGTNLRGNVVGTFLATKYDEEAGKNIASRKDPVAFADHITSVAKSVAATQLASIDDQKPNIYAAPPPSVVLANVGVKSNPFIASVVLPMVDLNPQMKLDANTLMAKAIDFAKDNPANFNVAAEGIAAYYRQATLTNNMVNRYVENGLPEQKTYNAKISGKNMVLSDPTSVKRAMLVAQVGTPSMFFNSPDSQ